MDKSARARMAPYISAVALQKFFQRVTSRNMPQEIDEGLLQDLGIPKGDVYALISALKFLGVIDNGGRLTEDFSLLQATEGEFRHNLAMLTQRAYSLAVTRLDLMQDSREQIRSFFSRNYSPSQSDKATSLFLFLCKESGIPLGEHLISRKAARARRQTQVSPKPRRILPEEAPSEISLLRAETVKESPPPTTLRETEKGPGLKERYARKLIEAELNITVAPGVSADVLKEVKEILQMRHKLIREMLREIERTA